MEARKVAARAIRVLVNGRVQRVGYRRHVLDAAQEHSIAGYVRNEKDGSVSIFAQGDGARLDAFLAKARNPPQPAQVKGFKEGKARSDPKVKYFVVRFGSTNEELQEGFGAMQTEFRDYREEFSRFAERTDGNFRELQQKYGEISEKLTRIMEALAEESKKSREMLEAMREESRQGRETLAESLRLLREAINRLPRQQ